jgi:hypothetical protein
MLLLNSINSFSQQRSYIATISHRIDSICMANDVKYCQVNYNEASNGNVIRNGKLRLDDCFLIIDDIYYYDLSKLVDFYIGMSYGSFFEGRKKALIISFQR